MKPNVKWYLIFLFALSANVLAQVNRASTEFQFSTSLNDNTLPSASTLAIGQDSLGFMWFGTTDGLLRFDGYKSKIFKNSSGNSSSIKSNTVTAFLSDSSGRFWIGTDEGVQEFNFQSQSFNEIIPNSTYLPNPRLKKIRSIVEDKLRNVWIGTEGGLIKYEPSTKEISVAIHHPSSSMEAGRTGINSLTVDRSNNLWIGTDIGLYFLNQSSNEFEEIKLFDPQLGKGKRNSVLEVTSVHFSHAMDVLMVGTTRGLYSINGNYNTSAIERYLKRIKEIPADGITILGSNNNGDLWVGTTSDGFFFKRKQDEKFHNIRHSDSSIDSLLDDSIFSMFQDASSVLWVGSAGGISKTDLASGGFRRIPRGQGEGQLADLFITSITGNGKDKIYLGTKDTGVVLWDRKNNSLRTFRHKPSERLALYRDHILTVTLDKKGGLWVSTPTGIEFLDEHLGKFVPLREKAGDPQIIDTISSICDRFGKIWFTSRRGLFKFDPETKTSNWIRAVHNDNGSEKFESTYLIAEDQKGNILFTTDNGLQRITANKSTYDSNHTEFDTITSLVEDDLGRIWTATDNGLNVSRHYSLPRLYDSFIPTEFRIKAIVQDNQKNLWLSTTKGVAKFDPNNYSTKHIFQNVGRYSGAYLGSNTYVDENNTIYFGGPFGLTYFNPDELFENLVPPKVSILSIRISNKTIDNTKQENIPQEITFTKDMGAITVPYSQSAISIEYTALHFANSKENKYRYILENFDQDWIESDYSKNYVQYSNLNPGKYRFRVMAATPQQVWSDEATINFIVAPPYWKTTGFWIGIVSLFLLLAWYAHNITIRRHQRIKAALEAEVRQRTLEIATQNKNKSKFIADAAHDLRQPIHAIGNLLEATRIALKKRDEDKSLELLELAKNATSLIHKTFNSVLELSRLETGLILPNYVPVDLNSFLLEIISTFSALSNEKSIEIKLAINVNKNYVIRSDRILLSRVLANLISNSIKYSKPSNAKVTIKPVIMENRCRLYVLDNGIGMEKVELEKIFQPFYQIDNPEHDREKGLGLGLSIVNATISLLDDHSINVCSIRDKGTLFYLDLPLTTPLFPDIDPIIELRKSETFNISGLYIIYVEDDLLVRTSTEILLAEFGVLVSSFKSGEELFDALNTIERLPDMILTDHNLPNNVTSENIIESIRREFDEEIPAIVISGDFIDTHVRLQSTANVILSKPVFPSELIRQIQKTYTETSSHT